MSHIGAGFTWVQNSVWPILNSPGCQHFRGLMSRKFSEATRILCWLAGTLVPNFALAQQPEGQCDALLASTEATIE